MKSLSLDLAFFAFAILVDNWFLCIAILVALILLAFIKSGIVQVYIMQKEETRRHELSLEYEAKKSKKKPTSHLKG